MICGLLGRRPDARYLAGKQRTGRHLDIDDRIRVDLKQARDGQPHGAQAEVREDCGMAEHGHGHDAGLRQRSARAGHTHAGP